MVRWSRVKPSFPRKVYATSFSSREAEDTGNERESNIYGNDYLLKHIFLVWLDLGAGKMAGTATDHWNEDPLWAALILTTARHLSRKTASKGKLKTKSYTMGKLSFLLVFFSCHCPSKCKVDWMSSFYNLYSGKFKLSLNNSQYISHAHVPAVVLSRKYPTLAFVWGYKLTKRNPSLLEINLLKVLEVAKKLKALKVFFKTQRISI